MVQTAPRVTESELVSAEQFCRDLVAETVRSPLSMDNHPFVRAIAEGKSTRAQLIEFGTGMFKLVFDAQRWTAAAYVAAEDQGVRQRMLKSMYEEETGALTDTDAHAELVADWLEALGQPRAVTYERAKLLKPHYQAFCDYSEFLGRCRPYWLFRGAVSLAGEAHSPPAFRTIVKAMREHYNMTDEKALRFYTLHIPVDEEHTDNAVWLVKPFLTSEENRELLRHTVTVYMDARYRAWLEPLGEIGYSVR